MSHQTRRSVLLAALLGAIPALAPMPAGAQARPIRLVAYGDSLVSGYGLQPAQAFPAQLEAALRARGIAAEVINSGVSGNTAEAGLARFARAVPQGTDAVILELGANDMLRRVDPARTEAALDRILGELRRRNIPVLIAGMIARPGLEPEYRNRFNTMYQRLARKHGASLYPYFLDGVVSDRRLNQWDGVHPNAEGVAVIVARILPATVQLLRRVSRRTG